MLYVLLKRKSDGVEVHVKRSEADYLLTGGPIAGAQPGFESEWDELEEFEVRGTPASWGTGTDTGDEPAKPKRATRTAKADKQETPNA
jgi:hypothetical protein